MGYGFSGFGWEFFRGDTNRTTAAGLPEAQVISLVVAVISLAVIVTMIRRQPAFLSSGGIDTSSIST
jgi:prolipoprotein diacylglyceryltransferase